MNSWNTVYYGIFYWGITLEKLLLKSSKFKCTIYISSLLSVLLNLCMFNGQIVTKLNKLWNCCMDVSNYLYMLYFICYDYTEIPCTNNIIIVKQIKYLWILIIIKLNFIFITSINTFFNYKSLIFHLGFKQKWCLGDFMKWNKEKKQQFLTI
jgi:hypothetical protein